MKKVLITGADSYIGTSFENYISKNYPDNYFIIIFVAIIADLYSTF